MRILFSRTRKPADFTLREVVKFCGSEKIVSSKKLIVTPRAALFRRLSA